MESVLEREYEISPASKTKAYKVFIKSGNQAGLFYEEDGVIKYLEKTTERKVEEKAKELKKEKEFERPEDFATLKSDEFSFAVKKELSAIEFARSQINSFLDYWKSKLGKEN